MKPAQFDNVPEPVSDVTLPGQIERKVRAYDDPWWVADGEPIFDNRQTFDIVVSRFREMQDTEWDIVAMTGMARMRGAESDYQTRATIRTKDRDEFFGRLNDRLSDVFDGGKTLAGVAKPTVLTDRPRKTVLSVDYTHPDQGRVAMGERQTKRKAIIGYVRAFEEWEWHTEAVEPLFREYEDKYPY